MTGKRLAVNLMDVALRAPPHILWAHTLNPIV